MKESSLYTILSTPTCVNSPSPSFTTTTFHLLNFNNSENSSINNLQQSIPSNSDPSFISSTAISSTTSTVTNNEIKKTIKLNINVENNNQSSTSKSSSSSLESSPQQIETPPSPTTAIIRNTVLQKLTKWSELDNYGTPLSQTHIIPLKTPITTKFLESSKKWKPFTTQDFVVDQIKRGYIVGGIIDLSNHDCIYDVNGLSVPKNPINFIKQLNNINFINEIEKDTFIRYIISTSELRKQSIYLNFTEEQKDLINQTESMPLIYMKVRCIAKEIPGVTQQEEFNQVVNSFLERYPDHYLGVHCSYGFNRTGFICCAYLITEKHIPIDEALSIFATSKPPGIKHKWFLRALRKRYGEESNEDNNSSDDNYREDDDNCCNIQD
ncbi:hypothetical protein ABK040_005509 [Willaertia magna]